MRKCLEEAVKILYQIEMILNYRFNMSLYWFYASDVSVFTHNTNIKDQPFEVQLLKETNNNINNKWVRRGLRLLHGPVVSYIP